MKTPLWLMSMFVSLAAVILPTSVASAAPSEWALPPDDPAVISQSMKDVQACLSQAGSTLAVYYLIDTSGSMETSDSQGLRYKAIESSIKPLAKLTDPTSQEPHPVKVAAGTFSTGFSPVSLDGANSQGWVDLTQGNEPRIAVDLSKSVIRAGTAGGTNWTAAIEGASASLASQKTGADGKPNCQMLVWLTDGGIDVSDEPGAAAETAALESLCGASPASPPKAEPSGLMFQLRDSGVAVLGLLLSAGELGGEKPLSRMSYFRPVVEGTGSVDSTFFVPDGKVPSTYACGQNVEGAQGAQLLTRDASQLATTFAQMINCFVETCTNGRDPVNRKPEWDLWMPTGVSKVLITAPVGSELTAAGEAWCNDSHPCQRTPLGELETITVTDFGNYLGRGWKLRPKVFDSARPPSYYYYVDVELKPVDTLTVESGKDARFDLTAVRGDGAANLDSTFTSVSLSAKALVPGSTNVDLSYVRSGDTWTLDPAAPFRPPQQGTVFTILELTADGPPGQPPIKFQEVQNSFSFQVTLPPGLPTVTSPADGASALFSTLEGPTGEATAEVVVVGDPKTDGQVCFGTPQVESDADPERITQYGWNWAPTLDSAGCASVSAGQTLTFTVTARNPQQFAATVKGYLPITVATATTPDEKYPSNRNFTLPTTTVKNETVLWIVVVALMFIGFLIPYGLLIALARRQARFGAEYDGSRWAALPVTLTSGGVPAVSEIPAIDYKYIFFDGSKEQREIEVGPTVHSITPPRFWPFRAPVINVSAPDGMVVFSNQQGVPERPTRVADSSAQISRVFYFVTPTPDARGKAPAVDDWDGGALHVASAPGDAFIGHVYVIVAGHMLQDGVSRVNSEVANWPQWSSIYDALSRLRNETPQPAAVGAAGGNDQPTDAAGKSATGSTTVSAEDDW